MIQHTITSQDLEMNPSLRGVVAEGEEIGIPEGETPAPESTEEADEEEEETV